MTFDKLPSIFKQLRPVSIGFDNLFDHFENILDGDDYFCTNRSNFPFYNLVKTGNSTYDIEIALAGYDKKDILVMYEDNLLRVGSNVGDPDDSSDQEKPKKGTIHKGIAKRYFSKVFTIANDVEIKGAELKNGLLKISLEKILPEGKKAKTITVK
jgi:molecular chaperone IbpA